jgi:DNA processing protein
MTTTTTATPSEDTELDSLAARATWSAIDTHCTAGPLTTALGHEEALAAIQNTRTAQALVTEGRATDRDITEWRAALDRGAADRALAAAARENIQILHPDSVPGLSRLGDNAPHALWARGTIDTLTAPALKVAATGSRASSSYGEHWCTEITTQLATKDAIIHTGFGYGIEGAATRAALAVGGASVAWLAGGVDRVYPAGHDLLAERMLHEDARSVFVSDAAPGVPPTAFRFNRRSALLGAAVDAVVVFEAGARSRSLIAARTALELGVPVYALPGPLGAPGSTGVHELIKSGAARLLTDAGDILHPEG